MAAGRKVLFKVLAPILVLVGILLILASLPEMFPDHGVVSDAIYEGNLDRVRELLDRGADPNSRRATLSTISKFLSKTGYTSSIMLDFSERTPLLIEALNREQFAIAQLLLDRGADPNVSDESGQSALARAWDVQAPSQLVELLLEKGARCGLADSGRQSSRRTERSTLWSPCSLTRATTYLAHPVPIVEAAKLSTRIPDNIS